MTDPQHAARRVASVPCAIITVSDTRTPRTDTSGALIRELLEAEGHRVVRYDVVPDEPDRVQELIQALCDASDCEAVLLTGGTGVANRDTTHEAVASLLVKRLDGFGELFRQLSYAEIGAAAMLSRATAGVRKGTVVFSMPGSTVAVRLAMERLILPQLGHIVALLRDNTKPID
jgi:molybdopterin adenylyltransferase